MGEIGKRREVGNTRRELGGALRGIRGTWREVGGGRRGVGRRRTDVVGRRRGAGIWRREAGIDSLAEGRRIDVAKGAPQRALCDDVAEGSRNQESGGRKHASGGGTWESGRAM